MMIPSGTNSPDNIKDVISVVDGRVMTIYTIHNKLAI